MSNHNLSNYNSVDLPSGIDLNSCSDLVRSCLVMAMDMSENGLSWAETDDILDILSNLNDDGSNLDIVAAEISELADHCN